MNGPKKYETSLEFVQRLTREAKERSDAERLARRSQMTKEGKVGEVKEEKRDLGGKLLDDNKAEGKRKHDSEIKICERYNEDDANITIISSDSVAFKVHSFILLRASSVFKNMVGIAQTGSQRGPLELTDEFVEHSQVVEATLDILYSSEIASFKDDKLYHHVIEFARKYDMTTILKTISSQLRAHATSSDKGNTLRLLRVAIDLGECDLMSSIVRATCGHVWPTVPGSDHSSIRHHRRLASIPLFREHLDGKKRPIQNQPKDKSIFPQKSLFMPSPNLTNAAKEYIEGAKAYDLGSWPYAEFAALPTPLAWALLRADQLAAKEYRLERTEAFGQQLQQLLDSMYPKDIDMFNDVTADLASGR